MAQALEDYMRERCPQCGTFPSDWFDEHGHPRLEPRWAGVHHICYGCKEIETVRAHVPEGALGVHTILIPWERLDEYDREEGDVG